MTTLDTGRAHYIVADGLGLNTIRVKGYSNVNLDLAAGQAHAICAENGSGKTELLLTLAGRMRPTEGSLAVDGVDCTRLQGMSVVRRMSGLAFFDNVNDVEDALTVASVTSAELGLAGKRSNRASTSAYLEGWGLVGHANDMVEELDAYTRDLLGIALGMAADPKILVVCDIERDLTEHQELKLVEMLRRVARETGTTVVCGVVDYDVAAAFDTATCITVNAMEQRAAYNAKHAIKEVA